MSFDAGARTAVETCMGVQPHEHVLVVADHLQREVGLAIFHAAEQAAGEALFMEMKPRKVSGEEPPKVVAAAMREADVCFLVTYYSISHTHARRDACKIGARVASMPFTSPRQDLVQRIFERGGMTADYLRLKENVEAFHAALQGVREVRVTSVLGTDLRLSVGAPGRPWDVDHGVLREPCGFTNLPAGEVYCAPAGAEGVMVVDGVFGDLGPVLRPLRLEIEGGRVTRFEGGFEQELRGYLDRLGPDVLNIAELGFGLNPRSEVIGVLLEDEKAGGTVHVALGNNASFGGEVKVPFHFDGVLLHPKVELDGAPVELNRYL